MKDFIIDQFKKSFEEFTCKKFNETYQVGLPDIQGPKPVKLKIYKDRFEIRYFEMLRMKTIVVRANDIVEVSLGIETVNTTSKTITGAIAGGIIGGGLGALAGASFGSNNNKQDVLSLIINYKGEQRPFILQTSKNTQKIYQLLKQIKS